MTDSSQTLKMALLGYLRGMQVFHGGLIRGLHLYPLSNFPEPLLPTPRTGFHRVVHVQSGPEQISLNVASGVRPKPAEEFCGMRQSILPHCFHGQPIRPLYLRIFCIELRAALTSKLRMGASGPQGPICWILAVCKTRNRLALQSPHRHAGIPRNTVLHTGNDPIRDVSTSRLARDAGQAPDRSLHAEMRVPVGIARGGENSRLVHQSGSRNRAGEYMH